jgi:hypothetical protein
MEDQVVLVVVVVFLLLPVDQKDPEEQVILHQHRHHKEILVEMDFGLVMDRLLVEAVVPVVREVIALELMVGLEELV